MRDVNVDFDESFERVCWLDALVSLPHGDLLCLLDRLLSLDGKLVQIHVPKSL